MADPQHLKQLDEGVEAWNRWRRAHPELRPDLSHALLAGRDLHEANFFETNLAWANLSETNLSRANLTRAGLRRADMARANLHQATLRRADLIYAKLQGTNLSSAQLRYVILRMAALQRANLSRADLTEADLRHADLREADLRHASLYRTNLRHAKMSKARLIGAAIMDADLSEADLTNADISEASLSRARLIHANLQRVNLRGADLEDANLRGANLSQANLRAARLQCTTLVEADLRKADLTGSSIYGVSVWNTQLEESHQQDLRITRPVDPAHFLLEPAITVDHLAAAQLLYLLFQNEHTPIIASLLSRIILILGRFTPERTEVLQTIQSDLWQQNYVPVMIDLAILQNQQHAALINALIGICRGILIELSEVDALGILFPRRNIPIQPLLAEGKTARDVFAGFYHRMLPLHRYHDMASLRRFLTEQFLPSLGE